MSKRAIEAALKAYPRAQFGPQNITDDDRNRQAYIKGYEQAEKNIITLIESRIGEIMGDAQPAPILRAELRDLINKLKGE